MTAIHTTQSPYAAAALEQADRNAAIYAAMLPRAEKELRAFVRKTNRWFALCDNLRATEGTDAHPAAVAAWSKAIRSNTSKTPKYRAYDNARTIERARELTTRASDFPALCALVGEPCNERVAANYA